MTRPGQNTVSGILVLDKPGGITSHDVVNRVRRLFKTRRVGHTGTLDPDATGVLVLCLGQACRLAEYLSASHKHYRAEVVFGLETDTLDASGQIVRERDATGLTRPVLLDLLPSFRGTIFQTPPMVSAIHHEGKRLYELAREGVEVERTPRQVEVSELSLTGFEAGARAAATFEVTCSSGTYIRVLAADIGAMAGTGAIMSSLRRTWVGGDSGRFTLAEATSLHGLEQMAGSCDNLNAALVPMRTAVAGWPSVSPQPHALDRLRNGIWLPIEALDGGDHPDLGDGRGPVAVLDRVGELCAVAQVREGRLVPVKVLARDADN